MVLCDVCIKLWSNGEMCPMAFVDDFFTLCCPFYADGELDVTRDDETLYNAIKYQFDTFDDDISKV